MWWEVSFGHTVLCICSQCWNFWQLPTAGRLSKDIGLSAYACRREAQNPNSASICWCSPGAKKHGPRHGAKQHPLQNSNQCSQRSYFVQSISRTAWLCSLALREPHHTFQVAEGSRHDWIWGTFLLGITLKSFQNQTWLETRGRVGASELHE